MNTVVSIRIPKSLLEELQELAKENHYLDLSEQIRDVIREKVTQRLKQETPPQKEQPTSDKEQIINELKKFLKELEDEK